MSSGLIGKKVGMTSVFDDEGNNVACTVVEAGPNVVTQVKSEGRDGYSAVQLGFDNVKEKNVTQAMLGHFEKAGCPPKRMLSEFRDFGDDVDLGDVVRVQDLFQEDERIDVVGVSKGKGFQGVVKRHGFSGVGMMTHGQSDRQRHPGSIGASADPSRVFKGVRMAGQTGGERTKIQNLRVVRILADQNAILIHGSVPGPKSEYVELHKK
ncbi:50S ribosomal protein L3 [Salinibacter ruber]|jgi:LSU ribosomal protein L3P|uniref:Large ribosomal subunit protein uL3 n=2 Tax=Salinibacter ruber TaxID=146919 RepID=RL3_SALRD|nr:50S ribosomal protein L3 [Salinibacter ruber]Q2S3R4.1 RecName: Full=Large ribosomal subunit protein uL3; AltName: Full=50S ribosomal protein L3 [Salinibacter ruber DSM 13855]ABC45749.1 ribosomal protein L3 [Salinibacter ruber DSM 13855]MCS3636999.1 large subunit ribosomal protein L3 [Salinibacter ruber]MCS3708022.1 large subunit ribosomal protein L3 [Salinibacter ruber]MCS4032038.1 large subunit ribosomal protein L3 [Salinibacter ruber]MCS4171798.1 large subunit ribosomal protein L3 [Salin